MDPITAFQVAGTVITFVEFSRSLLTDAHHVYKSPTGTTLSVVKLDQIAKDLAKTGDEVSIVLAQDAAASVMSSSDTLLKLCQQCKRIETEIQQVLGGLQARGDTKFNYAVSSVTIAFRASWSKSKIDDLDQRLQSIKSEMIMAILLSLWTEEKIQGKSRQDLLDRIEASVNRNDQKLDQLLQDLVQISAKGNVVGSIKRNQLFRELWRVDWKPDQDMRIQARPQSDDKITGLIQQDIINSLWFHAMDLRDMSITKPYRSTYEWIFDDESKTVFTDWLKGTKSPLYWITGKAGSGKSTLMKYIVHHPSTMTLLQDSTNGVPLLFSWFYFWEATTQRLQHSREGLVRTLLWHCLKGRPDVVAKVTPRRWAAYQALGTWDSPAPEWEWEELQETFQNLASLNGSSFRLVIFIDGLDEFGGDPSVLIDWINEIVNTYGIKTCVASRPWTAFSDAFDRYPSLTMQYLTAPDIDSYVRGHFETSVAFREWQNLSLSETQALQESLSIKADGVFLWVYLVVRDLASALSKGKSLSDLRSIVDSLPTNIIELYDKMYKNLDPEDAMQSSVYLSLQMASLGELETRTLWYIGENVWIPQEDLTAYDAAAMILKRRLDSSTRGILELNSHGSTSFHHRSAREWLLLSQVSSLILDRLPRNFDANLMLLGAFVNDPRENQDYRHFGLDTTMAFCYAMRVVESIVNGPLLIRHMDKLKEVLDQAAQAHVKANAPGFFKLAMQASRFSGRQNNTKDLNSKLEQGDRYEVGHWSLIYHQIPDHIEDCFTGVAAQFSIQPYVMAKVKENKKLLKVGEDRRSLLYNAIFGRIYHKRHDGWIPYHPIPFQRRLSLIEALLNAGASPKGCTFVRSRHGSNQIQIRTEYFIDAISRVRMDPRGAGLVGPEEYWTEVIRLLRRKEKWRFRSWLQRN